jgi:diguanylate cyclase (GGDEF)-like protein
VKYGNKIILSVLGIFGLFIAQSLMANDAKKRILVLHAYHQGFHWTDRIMAGIESVFEERDDIELFINYMDTKRRSDENYFKQLKDLYATKYELIKFDAIISSDDHALDFLLKYRDELFPGTPVIFSGLNDFAEDRLAGQKGYTGIYESYDVAGTIKLMLKLHPQTQNIAAITDNTRSGNIFKSLIEKAAITLPKNIQINYLHNLPQNNLQQALIDLPDNSLVLWAIYLRLPSGITLTSDESVRFVSDTSRFPTYCIWDVVGQGVVGGKITSPNFQGETAARIALKVLAGKPIDKISVEDSPLVYIFDHTALQRFDIPLENLPRSSIILNKPQNIYEQYKHYVWIYSVVLILLLTTVIFLVTIILLKRKRDKFEGMAMHDQLTGLYNRHYLQEAASKKLSEANRHQHPLCLLVLDIDYFKKVNDSYGHLVGDAVLKKVAKLLKNFSRSEDIVARIGGEEFVILLDHCDGQKGQEKAQKIRKETQSLNPNDIPITLSIGVATLSTEGESFSDLLNRADSAVYRAKSSGRNRVVKE